ncbi:MAG: MarR family transcriptional regulator [Eubacterium sp.]|nr:MarR family transcriptional regulator [Eubacterium sp.]
MRGIVNDNLLPFTKRKVGEDLKEKYIELHKAFSNFHKLNLSWLYPEMSHGEMVTLKVIADFEEGAIDEFGHTGLECDKMKAEKIRKTGRNGVNISQIVNQLCVAPPAVSRTLNSLEEKGLIERKVNKSDRRNTLVELTEMGRRANQEATAAVDNYMTRIMERVGEEAIQRAIEQVNYIYEIAKEELEILKREDK